MYKSRLAIGRPLGRMPYKRVRYEIRYDSKGRLVEYIDNQGVSDRKANFFARNVTLVYIKNIALLISINIRTDRFYT